MAQHTRVGSKMRPDVHRASQAARCRWPLCICTVTKQATWQGHAAADVSMPGAGEVQPRLGTALQTHVVQCDGDGDDHTSCWRGQGRRERSDALRLQTAGAHRQQQDQPHPGISLKFQATAAAAEDGSLPHSVTACNTDTWRSAPATFTVLSWLILGLKEWHCTATNVITHT